MSLMSLVSITALLMMYFLIGSTLGVALFFNVRQSQDDKNWMNDHANFSSFGVAMSTLFRVITGEAWHGILHYCMESNVVKGCEDPSVEEGCADPVAAVAFFVVFKLLGALILLNLFVAFIMDSFERAVSEKHPTVNLNTLHIFPEAWRKFDPDVTERIPVSAMADLVKLIPPPLGVGKSASTRKVLVFIFALHLHVFDGTVTYLEVFLALLRRAIRARVPHNHPIHHNIREEQTARIVATVPAEARKHYKHHGTTFAREFATRLLQKHFRAGLFLKQNAAKAECQEEATLSSGNGAAIHHAQPDS